MLPTTSPARKLYEFGAGCAAAGQPVAAAAAFRQAVTIDPGLPQAWRELGDALVRTGDASGAEAAFATYVESADDDDELAQISQALQAGRVGVAERDLTARLAKWPHDIVALRMLADSRMMQGRHAETERLLGRALELAPGFAAARHNFAVVQFRQGKIAMAIANLERLLQSDPDNVAYQMLLGSCLSIVGQYDRTVTLYEKILRATPDNAKCWVMYGNVLKNSGRRAESVAAYRTSLELAPSLGEAYWSLANLKNEPMSAGDIDAMHQQLANHDLPGRDRCLFHYALGHSFEQSGDYATSFAHYAEGAKLRRAEISYDAEANTALIRRTMAVFTAEFFTGRPIARPNVTPTPIFILGMPRAGSTLLEQILASHSAVEGTRELPEIGNISRFLGAAKGPEMPYPEIVGSLEESDFIALGARYLARTRIFRTTERPFFIDKMPPNWAHVGLIHLILPGARIIDARRAPMANCFAAFKQYFGNGQNATYDLAECGRYYNDYVALMAHFDQALPGRVHRVHYETLVADAEGEISRLLDYCGLPFEPACLRFWETERDVATPSSEQVRQPIFRESLELWRHFEPWLGPLKAALEEGRQEGLLF